MNAEEPTRNHAALRLAGLAGLSLALVLCSAVATQITAAHFGFDPALGADWGRGIYPPGQWVVWSLRHHDADPVFLAQLHIAMLSATGMLMVVTIVGIGIATRSARPYAAAHGSARFVTELAEMDRMGLVSAPVSGHALTLAGCVGGQGEIYYLRQTGNEHLAVIAPTRTGKGVGPVLMNAASWTGAFIMYDPKGEGFHATAGCHARLGPVWRWNPVAPHGISRFNPLDTIRLGTLHEVGDAMDIATLLVDPSSLGNWDHWKGTGFDLLTGVILHTLYKQQAEGKGNVSEAGSFPLGLPTTA